MIDLLADRFVMDRTRSTKDAWLDLATGRRVRVCLAAAGDRAEQLAWSDRCAELSRLRHPVFNELVDFGMADRSHTFEAYAADERARVSEPPGPRLVTHALCFLESRRLRLERDVAARVLRDEVPPLPRRRRCPIGIVLQPRRALAAIEEALAGATSGIASIDVSGPQGCGLRTLRLLAARAARLAGLVPIASRMLPQVSWLRDRIGSRHVCLFVDEPSSPRDRSEAASFMARMGASSARGHVMLRFVRSEARPPGAVEVEAMSVRAMVQMVFLGSDRTDEAALNGAARDSGGRPGVFLERLRAVPFQSRAPGVLLARELAPAYVVSPSRPSPPGPSGLRPGGIGRVLRDAPERGAKLARRGRHASAIRLLTRAGRVLEARGERSIAAACAEQLGWIERDRGRSGRALEAFARVRALDDSGVLGTLGAVGTGVIWTDTRRFSESEAVLRAASAAARVLGSLDLERRARRALARCLCWQERFDEASALLASPDARGSSDDDAETAGLESRLALALGDVRKAMTSGLRAAGRAQESGDGRLIAAAARRVALAHAAVGNSEQVGQWVARGLRAAADSHLPIASLRLRAIALRHAAETNTECRGLAIGGAANHIRAALRRRHLPALVRAELEAACLVPAAATIVSAGNRALRELQELLTLVHAADDDGAGLEELCRATAERTRAATVQIVTGTPSPRVLARAGRPWQGDTTDVDRILAGGAPPSVRSIEDTRLAAEPVRYGRESVAVLCCRWTAGTLVDASMASSHLKAAALAAAGPVRGILDRTHVTVAETAGDLIGASPAAAALREAIARAARAPFPVLIEGESGSGKELVARGVHRLSARRDRRLCTVNCAALVDDLLEAELFGHARGAFTGAIGERPGLFEEADGGTLFLDEVGELSARAQAKLLRVLQDGEVRRVGENLPRRVDARIVAATNRRLDDEVAAQRFRADLRFRLDVVRIVVPPLRERAGDIPALALHFWREAASRVGSNATLTAEALAALSRYDWPGNVRELQNVIASLAVHAPRRGRIVPAILPAHIARTAAAGAATFDAARQEFERRYVRAALAQAAGHRSRAARALGVSRQGLSKMLRRLGLEGKT